MKFYRFQSINKLTIQNLSNQKNWISDPYKFNDPFEFSLYDSFYYKNELIPQIRTENEINYLNKIRTEIENFGVISYSSDFQNNLLWAHYADNHKGMCFVFDVKKDKIDKMHKIKYQKIFPKIEFNNIEKSIIKIVTTKSIEWNYEKEYREVLSLKNTLYQYPGELIEIIFGCRTSKEDIEIILEILNKAYPNLILSKMKIIRNKYCLGKETSIDNTKIPHSWNQFFKYFNPHYKNSR